MPGENKAWAIEHALHDEFVSVGTPFRPVKVQGYCSYTVFGDNLVIQFRPPQHDLDMYVVKAAKLVYSEQAPMICFHRALYRSGLLMYTMERMHGISLAEYRSMRESLKKQPKASKTFCEGFAKFLARGWHHREITDLPYGMIGLSLRNRLVKLSSKLPIQFRHVARTVLTKLHAVEALPWILTHGDVVPGNIMVNPSSGQFSGMVDWAEAEMLPFGVCLYGLEEFLGHMTRSGFVYHKGADAARSAFWETLMMYIPELNNKSVLEAVLLAKDLGVLLWHGFAFDDGAIDRVVDPERDPTEIQYLETFLASSICDAD